MQELEKALEEIKRIKELYKNAAFMLLDRDYLPCEYDECDIESAKVQALSEAIAIIRQHMNDGWIPVEERLPEEKVNPVSQDFYEYQVTTKFGNTKDVRHYKYGNRHWWHGPGIVDEYVIAWRERPEPYRQERNDNHDRAGSKVDT